MIARSRYSIQIIVVFLLCVITQTAPALRTCKTFTNDQTSAAILFI